MFQVKFVDKIKTNVLYSIIFFSENITVDELNGNTCWGYAAHR